MPIVRTALSAFAVFALACTVGGIFEQIAANFCRLQLIEPARLGVDLMEIVVTNAVKKVEVQIVHIQLPQLMVQHPAEITTL